ncbi:hypothetical protein HU200_024700 [Digitaria exilis]|uniref:Uncharacterized protein n=1 Tax=Digitaria exilis TaxID=1010633 RepID=A0A835CBY8_9POAL|nr:hypothetical protein HU200_024700 [Digitaria exilis]
MDVIILMAWAIWMVRNEAIFRGVQPSLQGCKNHFQKEFALLLLRAKKGSSPAYVFMDRGYDVTVLFFLFPSLFRDFVVMEF